MTLDATSDLLGLEAEISGNTESHEFLDLIEGIADGLAVFDGAGTLLFANRRLKALWRREGDWLRPGQPFSAICHAVAGKVRAKDGVIRAAADARQALFEHPPGGMETDLGRGRWLHEKFRATGGGHVTWLCSDISDLKERETRLSEFALALVKERDGLIAANQAKTEALAVLSHELRTPLSAIIGFAEIIRDGLYGPLENARYLDYVNDIHTSGSHSLALINDILDISKLEAGKLTLTENQVPCRALVAQAVRLVRDQARRNGVQIKVAVAPDLGLLKADEQKMKRVLINLLSNGVKFTESGGAVSISVALDGDGHALFRVADSGVGMALDDIPRALEPFSQITNRFSSHRRGTGLGLPLVKRLVELHQGALTIESSPGEGTTATVRLPPERVVDGAGSGQYPLFNA